MGPNLKSRKMKDESDIPSPASIELKDTQKSFNIELSEIPLRMIDLGPKKRKQELHGDLQFMLEYNGYPSTWESDGKPMKLAKATKKQLWDKFIDMIPIHWEKAKKRFNNQP